jgi:hypothetical protein
VSNEKAIYRVYDYMQKGSEDGLEWKGFAKYMAGELSVSMTTIYSALEQLKAMGCVVMKFRGGGNLHSVWTLIKPPNQLELNVLLEKAAGSVRTPTQISRLLDSHNNLVSRVNELELRVKELESGFNVRRDSSVPEV